MIYEINSNSMKKTHNKKQPTVKKIFKIRLQGSPQHEMKTTT